MLLEIHKRAAQFYYVQLKSSQGEQAMAYLRGRQLGDDTIKAFGLGYSSKFSNTLYQFLKSKGYADDMLAKSGLITMDESMGLMINSGTGSCFPSWMPIIG